MLKNSSSTLLLGGKREQIFVSGCVSRYAPGALSTAAPEGPYSVFDDAEASGT
jgi:hypothetical protein